MRRATPGAVGQVQRPRNHAGSFVFNLGCRRNRRYGCHDRLSGRSRCRFVRLCCRRPGLQRSSYLPPHVYRHTAVDCMEREAVQRMSKKPASLLLQGMPADFSYPWTAFGGMGALERGPKYPCLMPFSNLGKCQLPTMLPSGWQHYPFWSMAYCNDSRLVQQKEPICLSASSPHWVGQVDKEDKWHTGATAWFAGQNDVARPSGTVGFIAKPIRIFGK